MKIKLLRHLCLTVRRRGFCLAALLLVYGIQIPYSLAQTRTNDKEVNTNANKNAQERPPPMPRRKGGLIDDILSAPQPKDAPAKKDQPKVEDKKNVENETAPAERPGPVKQPAKAGESSESQPNRIRTKPESKKGGDKEPVHIASQGMRASLAGGVAELDKDVVITQGELRLESDHGTVNFNGDTDEVEQVHVRGNVKVTKDAELPVDRVVAKGDDAVFYNAERKVILRGNARLWRGGDLVKGTQITYDMETGWITVDRVEGMMQPGEKASDTKSGS